VYEIADVFIVVVNDLTIVDQEFIDRICTKQKNHLHKERPRRKLIVIHNFKDISLEVTAKAVWELQVKGIYPGNEHQENVYYENGGNRIVEWFGTPYTKHCYIMKDVGTAAEYNKVVFQMVRTWISSDRPDGRVPLKLMDTFRTVCQTLLRDYITNVKDVFYDVRTQRLVANPKDPDTISEIQHLSEDLATGLVTSVQDTYIPKFDIIEMKPNECPDDDHSKNIWLLSIDAPGFSPQDVKVKIEKSNVIITGEKKTPGLEGYRQVGQYASRTTQYGAFELVINLNLSTTLVLDLQKMNWVSPNQYGLLKLKIPQQAPAILLPPNDSD